MTVACGTVFASVIGLMPFGLPGHNAAPSLWDHTHHSRASEVPHERPILRVDGSRPLPSAARDQPPAKAAPPKDAGPGREPERSHKFLPSLHGFQFRNSFPGYPPPFDIAGLPELPDVPTTYGLCGGMSFAAADFHKARRPIPEAKVAPASGNPLHDYLYERQLDSLGVAGAMIPVFATWMALPDDTLIGTQHLTFDELKEAVEKLKRGELVVLGLVYVSADTTLEIWKNHQVLAYECEVKGDDLFTVRIYDPNHPGRDDVSLRGERVQVGTEFDFEEFEEIPAFGVKCIQIGPEKAQRSVRGFFVIPYEPEVPPEPTARRDDRR